MLHIGLSSTLQNWASLLQNVEVETFSNVGTCGIDGPVSTLIGASLCCPEKLYFGVVGDLTFFYDMNSLGNRHVTANFRLLVNNNGCGGLFHTPNHLLEQFSNDLDFYYAAGGHFGRKSRDLLKHYAMDLGFDYLSASTKDEFEKALPIFLSAGSERPIVFECFTDVENDRIAWGARMSLDNYTSQKSLLTGVKNMMPKKMKNIIKAVIK